MCVWSCGLGICFGYERGISSAIGKLRGGERAPKPSSLSCDWYLGSPMRATPNTIPRRVTTSAILNPRPRYSYCSVTPVARTTALHVHVVDAWVRARWYIRIGQGGQNIQCTPVRVTAHTPTVLYGTATDGLYTLSILQTAEISA